MTTRMPSMRLALLLAVAAASGRDGAAQEPAPPPPSAQPPAEPARTARDREDAQEDAWVNTWRDAEWRQNGIRLTMASTYNRVEGWPVVFGPYTRREFDWGRVAVDAFGIFRTAEGRTWNTATTGHRARAEVRVGRNYGLTLGARSYDVVDAVEPWYLGAGESGLASFFFQRDFRDWYDRQGGQGYARLFAWDGAVTLGATYGNERWRSRRIHDVFAMFVQPGGWRENPLVDDGTVHLATGHWTLDTRNDPIDPTSGWYAQVDLERGTGTLVAAPSSAGVRGLTTGTANRVTWDRAFADVRRYSRLGPDAEVRLRVVAGGWLGGDALPMQRRLSLSGPGAMPGYAFRAPGGAAWLDCAAAGTPVAGSPAQCDRVALAQIEYRSALRVDVFDWLGAGAGFAAPPSPFEPPGRQTRRHRGWSSHTRGSLVVFADAGRGWLVGPTQADQRFVPGGRLPSFATWRTDVGAGLELGAVGLYGAKAVGAGDGQTPAVFFVRLHRRF